MCGIVGYIGSKPACDILINGLSTLEYRGYDSAGVSIFSNGVLHTIKAKGRLKNLEEKLLQNTPDGTCGIAHTRWATHGEPSDTNAHPHTAEKVSLVHNGIIENYHELKKTLVAKGYSFSSETDTEIAAKLIDSLYDGDPLQAISQALKIIEGAYAFAIVFADRPKYLYAARKDNPLIVALGTNENFIASDIAAVLGHTREYFTLSDGEIAEITQNNITVFDTDLNPVPKKVNTATWNIEQAQKDGYEHFMLKEIYEQPVALYNTVHPRIQNSLPNFEYDSIPDDVFKNCERIHVVACGTAMHSGIVGRDLIEGIAGIPVDVQIASEFRYRNPVLGKNDLVVIVSQSGETADSIAALRLAKQRNIKTLAIVNVTGSSIAREADYVIYTHAGPEIAVASTKAYSVQVSVMYLLAFKMALINGAKTEDFIKEQTELLLKTISLVKTALLENEYIEKLAHRFTDAKSLFFIGRGLDYALSCEGSLKLKEISYIHCEAYAAGELKHGTISLITKDVPVIAVATQTALLPKMVSNIKEVNARGADVLLICKNSDDIDHDVFHDVIKLPTLPDLFMPLLTVSVLQLLSYHVAVQRGCDVDKPRNLAKSVTVE